MIYFKILFILIFQYQLCYGFFEIAGSIGAGLLGMGAEMVCRFRECCSEKSIPANFEGLRNDLNTRVYGQHLVEEVVVSALKSHWTGNPAKPLTMSFHGWPGCGKNYVSQFIAKNLYTEGMKSKFVHMFVGRIHFPLLNSVDEYKMNLYNWIKGNVSSCPRQLFIFDEVDKMPPGVLNGIKPLLDYRDNIDGVDYRQAIFIFLSNTGSKRIIEHFLEMWNDGYKRESLRMKDFEDLITLGAFNEEGSWLGEIIYDFTFDHLKPALHLYSSLSGFYHSDTIISNLIDHFIPFLPMERSHVHSCILDQFKERNVTKPTENEIAEAFEFITWGPTSKPIFSKTGCKRISQKVGVIAARRRMH